MVGADGEHRGVDAVRRWLRESGYGTQRQSRGAFAVTLHLLELVFARQPKENEWHKSRPAGKVYVGSRAQLLRTMIGICVR